MKSSHSGSNCERKAYESMLCARYICVSAPVGLELPSKSRSCEICLPVLCIFSHIHLLVALQEMIYPFCKSI